MTYKQHYSRMFYKDKYIFVWVRLMWESSSWYESLHKAQKPLPQADFQLLSDRTLFPLPCLPHSQNSQIKILLFSSGESKFVLTGKTLRSIRPCRYTMV